MSSTPMTLKNAADAAVPFADPADEFALGSLPETFELAATTARTLVAAEAEALAEVAALCDTLEQQQPGTPIAHVLHALRAAADQATTETRDLLAALETMVDETSHLVGATEADNQLAMKLVEAARRYGSEADAQDLISGAAASNESASQGPGSSAFARVMAALEAMPAAMAVALEGRANSPREAAAA